jgi:hypothetical protein
MLIDEADAFMAKRDEVDTIEQMSMVSCKFTLLLLLQLYLYERYSY